MSEALFPEPGTDPREPSEPPVPPLRLRRVRLQGVGPDGARFDPLDLDFATEDGAASRVLLSLTNTGGKSTLITLLCSVVVPASRAQVGGKARGAGTAPVSLLDQSLSTTQDDSLEDTTSL